MLATAFSRSSRLYASNSSCANTSRTQRNIPEDSQHIVRDPGTYHVISLHSAWAILCNIFVGALLFPKDRKADIPWDFNTTFLLTSLRTLSTPTRFENLSRMVSRHLVAYRVMSAVSASLSWSSATVGLFDNFPTNSRMSRLTIRIFVGAQACIGFSSCSIETRTSLTGVRSHGFPCISYLMHSSMPSIKIRGITSCGSRFERSSCRLRIESGRFSATNSSYT
ncbi:hypothetical protein IG631_23269 [Alternaria alternata]|nr:hypothetical protein IG631_23269 [Alternaria alternata]